jgi:hypothetical protein
MDCNEYTFFHFTSMKPFSFGCLAKRTSRKKDQQQKVNKPQFPITWKTKQK